MFNWLKRRRMPLVKWEPLQDVVDIAVATAEFEAAYTGSRNAGRPATYGLVKSVSLSGMSDGILKFEGAITPQNVKALRAAWDSGWRPAPGKWKHIPC